jgi:CheY-like chemotaxis protein
MPSGKILCIDDEELGLLVRKMVLESEGFEVAVASDGRSGLDLFNGGHFDLVVLDHSMPGMNGGEVAQELRRLRPQTPIILLSAYVTLPENHVALVDGYVTKGESTEALLAMVGRLMETGSQEAGRK